MEDTHSRPFSNNIIFLDTEFTHLDPKQGELLSIGLIKPSGEELYLEFDYHKAVDPWVVEHVLPSLEGITFPKDEAVKLIRQFVGDSQPFLLAYVNQLDAVYWYDLFGSAQTHPAARIPIDFSSILFAHGYPPNSMSNPKFLKALGLSIDYGNRGHNALDDARILKRVYEAFWERKSRIDV